MSKSLVAAMAALIVSIGLNVFLLVRSSSAAGETSRGASAASGRQMAGPLVAVVAEGSNRGSGSQPGSAASSYRNLDRATLERRLADAEARIHTLLPIEERFKLEEPNPESDGRLRPQLERLFPAKAGEDPAWEVECRGDICRLTGLDMMEWQDKANQDPQLTGMFGKMSFSGAETFVVIEEPGKAAAFRLLGAVLQPLYEGDAAKAIGECKRLNPAPTGRLSVAVNLDTATRRFRVDVDGDLSKQAVGVCVRRAVEDAVAHIVIPRDVMSMQEAWIEVTVP